MFIPAIYLYLPAKSPAHRPSDLRRSISTASPAPPSITSSTSRPYRSWINSGSVIYSVSSSSSTEEVSSGAPNRSTMARGIKLSGMRIPMVRRRSSALCGIRDDASSRPWKGPGRILFQQPELGVIHPAIVGDPPSESNTTENIVRSFPLIRPKPLDGLRRTDRAAEGIDAVSRMITTPSLSSRFTTRSISFIGRILGIDFNQHREGKYTEII